MKSKIGERLGQSLKLETGAMLCNKKKESALVRGQTREPGVLLPESSLRHFWTQFLHLVKEGYF